MKKKAKGIKWMSIDQSTKTSKHRRESTLSKETPLPLFQKLTKVAALAGKALNMAGPKPLNKAPAPSWATVFLAQSKNPV